MEWGQPGLMGGERWRGAKHRWIFSAAPYGIISMVKLEGAMMTRSKNKGTEGTARGAKMRDYMRKRRKPLLMIKEVEMSKVGIAGVAFCHHCECERCLGLVNTGALTDSLLVLSDGSNDSGGQFQWRVRDRLLTAGAVRGWNDIPNQRLPWIMKIICILW